LTALLIASGSPYPEPTERQRIGNQINATMIFARTNFVNVHIIFCERLPQAS
jgi:hypothetical protein